VFFSPWGVAFQGTTRRRCLEFLNLRADPPFLSKTFNALAQNGNAKAKNGKTTGMEICRMIYEDYPWNH
jgi:hypothetical protein